MEKTKTIKKVAVKKVVKAVEMKKGITLKGTVVSTKMQKTVIIAIHRKVAHKLYGKLINVTKRLKVDVNGFDVKDGDTVVVEQTRPMSKDKNFKIIATGKIKSKPVKKEEAK